MCGAGYGGVGAITGVDDDGGTRLQPRSMSQLPTSEAHVVHVEILRGARAPADAPPSLLVEVPHGADRRAHYELLCARLVGELPEDLHAFFHLNTDVGAWALGRATAERVLAREPERSALLVRCLVPRTFVDCNRPADFEGGDLDKGGLTAGIPVYVRDPRDRELLLDLHRRYVRAAEQAFEVVCGGGGVALVPHSYGPRSLGIARVDDDIVNQLRWACEPERHETWPLRAEVDLLTEDGDGKSWAPPGAEDALMKAFAEAGYEPRANETYNLHPASLAHGWSTRFPEQVLCLEVRRDLLVEAWTPFEEMLPVDEKVAKVADVIAPAVADALRRRPSAR